MKNFHKVLLSSLVAMSSASYAEDVTFASNEELNETLLTYQTSEDLTDEITTDTTTEEAIEVDITNIETLIDAISSISIEPEQIEPLTVFLSGIIDLSQIELSYINDFSDVLNTSETESIIYDINDLLTTPSKLQLFIDSIDNADTSSFSLLGVSSTQVDILVYLLEQILIDAQKTETVATTVATAKETEAQLTRSLAIVGDTYSVFDLTLELDVIGDEDQELLDKYLVEAQISVEEAETELSQIQEKLEETIEIAAEIEAEALIITLENTFIAQEALSEIQAVLEQALSTPDTDTLNLLLSTLNKAYDAKDTFNDNIDTVTYLQNTKALAIEETLTEAIASLHYTVYGTETTELDTETETDTNSGTETTVEVSVSIQTENGSIEINTVIDLIMIESLVNALSSINIDPTQIEALIENSGINDLNQIEAFISDLVNAIDPSDMTAVLENLNQLLADPSELQTFVNNLTDLGIKTLLELGVTSTQVEVINQTLTEIVMDANLEEEAETALIELMDNALDSLQTVESETITEEETIEAEINTGPEEVINIEVDESIDDKTTDSDETEVIAEPEPVDSIEEEPAETITEPEVTEETVKEPVEEITETEPVEDTIEEPEPTDVVTEPEIIEDTTETETTESESTVEESIVEENVESDVVITTPEIIVKDTESEVETEEANDTLSEVEEASIAEDDIIENSGGGGSFGYLLLPFMLLLGLRRAKPARVKATEK